MTLGGLARSACFRLQGEVPLALPCPLQYYHLVVKVESCVIAFASKTIKAIQTLDI